MILHNSILQDKKPYTKDYISKGSSRSGASMSLHKSNPSRELGQRATIAKICDEGKTNVFKQNLIASFFPWLNKLEQCLWTE